MGWLELLKSLPPRIQDIDEETYALFSEPCPSQDLGFVSRASSTIELSVANRDLSIVQSPGLLNSDRAEGTTGAVLWRVTPRFAEWIAAEDNVFHTLGILGKSSIVLELGCGISGIIPMLLAGKVGHYIATDQLYVFKFLRKNLEANSLSSRAPSRSKKSGRPMPQCETQGVENVELLPLDWETSSAASLSTYLPRHADGVDLIVACDCIYNEALIASFARTCYEICSLRHLDPRGTGKESTIVLIAQQLRSDTVFTAWLEAFSETFHVWRLPEELCSSGLQPVSGFVVHLAILKAAADDMSSMQE